MASSTWALVFFILGLCTLVLNLFTGLKWFTPAWGVMLMGFAFLMLTRVWKKEETGEKEKLRKRIQELEEKLRA